MPRRAEAQACALGSFHGDYTFANDGYQVDGSGSLSLTATAGRLIADGAGHVSASLTQSVNGSANFNPPPCDFNDNFYTANVST
jgi:hypothetical protein